MCTYMALVRYVRCYMYLELIQLVQKIEQRSEIARSPSGLMPKKRKALSHPSVYVAGKARYCTRN